jgi:hypothetical protein
MENRWDVLEIQLNILGELFGMMVVLCFYFVSYMP